MRLANSFQRDTYTPFARQTPATKPPTRVRCSRCEWRFVPSLCVDGRNAPTNRAAALGTARREGRKRTAQSTYAHDEQPSFHVEKQQSGLSAACHTPIIIAYAFDLLAIDERVRSIEDRSFSLRDGLSSRQTTSRLQQHGHLGKYRKSLRSTEEHFVRRGSTTKAKQNAPRRQRNSHEKPPIANRQVSGARRTSLLIRICSLSITDRLTHTERDIASKRTLIDNYKTRLSDLESNASRGAEKSPHEVLHRANLYD